MPSKGIVYYTDGKLDPTLFKACRKQLKKAINEQDFFMQAVSVTLGPDIVDFGQTICLNLERGYLTMFKQILAGLERITTDIVYLCEHDVLYHPTHFRFTPPDPALIYYNQHVYKVDATTGKALHYRCSQTSGLCAKKEVLLAHYQKRVAKVETDGFTRKMGFEPGTHNRLERVDDLKSEVWMSAFPNIDIRHTHNLTPSRWSPAEFRNPKFAAGWTEASEVPGWGITANNMPTFLLELS